MVFTTPIRENIMRVVCTPEGTVKPSSFMMEALPQFEGECLVAACKNQERTSFLYNGRLLTEQVSFLFEPREVTRYTFAGGKPKIVTERTVDGERSFVENAEMMKVADSNTAHITFQIDADECIYGLGQHEDGVYNYRETTEYLYHNNMKIPMPVFLSSKNYAIFFDCTSMMKYTQSGRELTVTLDAVDQIDFYLIAGECFDDLVGGIRMLTGQAVMMPKWVFGYIQSKERYKTQEEILETAARFREENIPLGCIVLDWMSWEEGKWGNKIFDKSRFPDARAMVDELHKNGVAFMISIWPNMKEGCENNEEFAKAGKLLCNYSTYDAFDEEARDIYWRQCEKELFAAGTDAWWCDSTEPFTPDWNGEVKRPDEVRYELAQESTNKYLDARVSSAYPVAHARGIYEHQRQADASRRVVNLTRAGYPGIWKYGTILWSGDIAATWDVLRSQVAEGLSICMCGVPYWTFDIGGFFVGNTESWKRWANQTEGQAPWFWHGLFEDGVHDKGYCELYVRWLQLGTFLPVMRSHGTDTPREPWQFGEKGTVYYDTIVKYIRLRYAMMPYTYSLAAQVPDGGTMMRSLMFDFAGDKNVRVIADEFMYGPAFLVCPVLEPLMYGPDSALLNKPLKRSVYLPKGALWYDSATKAQYPGGSRLSADAPVEHMPLYIRSGAIIPKSKTGDIVPDQLEIYAGSDGLFVVTLDNGTDYAYEEGEMLRIPILWNDEERKLVIDRACGNYEHCSLDLAVDVYGIEEQPVGLHVTYDGERTEITV